MTTQISVGSSTSTKCVVGRKGFKSCVSTFPSSTVGLPSGMFKDTPSLSSLNDDENLKDILPVKSSSFPTDGFALRPPTELSKPSASSVNSRDNLFSDLFGLDGSELEISASENK